jgi:hypothetical protein
VARIQDQLWPHGVCVDPDQSLYARFRRRKAAMEMHTLLDEIVPDYYRVHAQWGVLRGAQQGQRAVTTPRFRINVASRNCSSQS